MNGIIGLNARAFGVSRDMVTAAQARLQGAFMLVHDDPALAEQVAAAGARVIYRQSTDDGSALDTSPEAFVAERAKNAPSAAYLHLLNEVDPSADEQRWSRAAMLYAERIGRKVCLFNYSTNRSVAQWEQARGNVAYAATHGHICGLHLYDDLDHLDGGRTWLPLKQLYGGLWLVTEFAYIRTIFDGNHGWRGKLTPEQYAAFLERHAAWFASQRMPVALFSFDNWPANDAGRASGFGIWDSDNLQTQIGAINQLYTWKGIAPMPTPTPAPTPPVINVPATPGTSTVMRVRATTLNLRVDHATNATVVRTLAHGEQVAVYLDTATPLLNGYAWVYVETNKEKGWAALRGAWGESFGSIDAPTFSLINPVACESVISSLFGVARDYDGDGLFDDRHEGLDLTIAHKGCHPPIMAGADGVVIDVSSVGDYGNHVKVESKVGAETFVTWYCHLETVFVKTGDTVKAGQYLGIMGTTGNSSGIHVHINVQHIGHGLSGFVVSDTVDPLPFISPSLSVISLAA